MEEIMEISLDGFQVVSGEMLRKPYRVNAPTVTLWPNSIRFNKASLVALNYCERIRLEVNSAKRCMLIVPVTEKDRDNVRWVKSGKDSTTRKMECTGFVKQLYDCWGWKNHLSYRTSGRLVSADKKVMLLFDFSSAESWVYKPKKKANRNAGD